MDGADRVSPNGALKGARRARKRKDTEKTDATTSSSPAMPTPDHKEAERVGAEELVRDDGGVVAPPTPAATEQLIPQDCIALKDASFLYGPDPVSSVQHGNGQASQTSASSLASPCPPVPSTGEPRDVADDVEPDLIYKMDFCQHLGVDTVQASVSASSLVRNQRSCQKLLDNKQ